MLWMGYPISVEGRRCVAVIGTSGSGKSTLLNIDWWVRPYLLLVDVTIRGKETVENVRRGTGRFLGVETLALCFRIIICILLFLYVYEKNIVVPY